MKDASQFQDEIDKILSEKEKKNKYKDTEGRIGGSAKERRALSRILLGDLDDIEKDAITAQELIKKDKVFPKIDIAQEKDSGTSSGATYLKTKFRLAIGKTPPNNKDARKVYVGLINSFIDQLENVKTYFEFEHFVDSFQKYIIPQTIKILNPNLYKDLELEEYKQLVAKRHEDLREEIKKGGLLYISIIKENFDAFNEHAQISNKEIERIEEILKDDDSDYSPLVVGRWTNIKQHIPEEAFSQLEQLNQVINDLKDKKREAEKVFNNLNTTLRESDQIDYNALNSNIKINYAPNLLKHVFGDKFIKFLRRSGKTYDKWWNDALTYEGLSKKQADMLFRKNNGDYMIERISKYSKEKRILESLTDPIKVYHYFENNKPMVGFSYGDFARLRKVSTKGGGSRGKYWYWGDVKIYANAKDDTNAVEFFKKRYLTYINKQINNLQEKVDALKEKYQEREDNWEWTGAKKTAKGKKKSDITLHAGVPLSYIKRTSGLIVEDKWLETDESLKKFFKEVIGVDRIEYGLSLPDTERKEHARHFSQSLLDMFEILNMDVRTVIRWGEKKAQTFGIQFASAGKGRAMAHYTSSRVAMNLTRKAGDGTVAHEFAHYLDDFLGRLTNDGDDLKSKFGVRKRESYGSTVVSKLTEPSHYWDYREVKNIENVRVYSRMRDIFKFIALRQVNLPEFEGMEKVNVTVQIPAVKEDKYTIPLYHDATFEEYMQYFKNDYPRYFKYENLTKKTEVIFGQVAKKYDKEFIDVEFTSKHSGFYTFSQAQGGYWKRPTELFARAFEVYIKDKLENANRTNNYLVSGSFDHRVYPQDQERVVLFKMFDALFRAIKEEYKIPDFSVPESYKMERGDEYIELETKKEHGVIKKDDGEVEIIGEDKDKRKKRVLKKVSKATKALEEESEISFEFGGDILSQLSNNLFTFVNQ